MREKKETMQLGRAPRRDSGRELWEANMFEIHCMHVYNPQRISKKTYYILQKLFIEESECLQQPVLPILNQEPVLSKVDM